MQIDEKPTTSKRKVHPHLIDSLKQILQLAHEQENLSIRTIVTAMAKRGYAALLIILSAPFCIPINIPGLSTPFGIVLAFIGFRIAFGKRQWWPKWLLDKSVQSRRLVKPIKKMISLLEALKKILLPRLTFMVDQPFICRFNGLLIAFLAMILTLPVPVPMTNVLTALPIFCIGLGNLEDDGLMILLSYALTLLCISFFILLFLFGKTILNHSIL